MEILFLDAARKEFKRLPDDLQHLFLSHFETIRSMPPRRHMRYGIPSHVEKVTRQAQIVYEIHEDTLYILHCFADHKEYEQWFNSYR